MDIEYRVIDLEMRDRRMWDAALARLGKDGWQLAGMVPLIAVTVMGFPEMKGATCVFMRPRTRPPLPVATAHRA